MYDRAVYIDCHVYFDAMMVSFPFLLCPLLPPFVYLLSFLIFRLFRTSLIHISIQQPKEYQSELMCFYYDNNRTPRLIIQPVKVEIVFPEPRLYVLR